MEKENLELLGELDMSTGGNKALQEDVFERLKEVDELTAYLRDVMSEDVKRYFNATTPMEQLLIKGAYFRMKYLLNMLSKEGSQKETKKKRVTSGVGRYAD